MGTTFRELEYFVALAEQRHFGRAAQTLGVSQPTLSMQFRKLERRLGGDLVERLPREAILTARGRELLPVARQILELVHQLHSPHAGTGGRVRIGIIPTLSPYLLPLIDRKLGHSSRQRRISLSEGQTGDLVQRVKDGLIDVAILSTPLYERGLVEIELFSEPFYLAVHRKSALAKRRQVHLHEIRGEKLLLLEDGHCLRNQALTICNLPPGAFDTDLSATSIETLRSMVSMGAGVTLIPKLAVKQGDGLTYIPIADESARRHVGLLHRPSFSDQAFVQELAEIVTSAARSEKMKSVRSEAAAPLNEASTNQNRNSTTGTSIELRACLARTT